MHSRQMAAHNALQDQHRVPLDLELRFDDITPPKALYFQSGVDDPSRSSGFEDVVCGFAEEYLCQSQLYALCGDIGLAFP
jgi:hypothetical protein